MPRLGPRRVSANVYGPRTDTAPSAARKRETGFPDNPNFLITTGGAKELVAEVYSADKPYRDVAGEKDVKRGKKYYEAAEHILNALVAGSTTLVSDMSLSLADKASADEMKNAQEQLSGWLQRSDFETGLNDYLMEKAKPLVGRTTTLALDFSDLSKPFGTIGAKRK